VAAATSEAQIVRALDAVVAVRVVATLATRPVAALLGRFALGRAGAHAIGTTLVDGTGIRIVAIFWTLAGDLVADHAREGAA